MKSELPIPVGRALFALGQSLPQLLGYAGISATVFIGSAVGSSAGARAGVPLGAIMIALAALFAILHAIYLVAASRVIARHCDDAVVEKLSLFGWLRATFAVLIVVAGTAAFLSLAIMILTPYQPMYRTFVGTTAAIAWMPFLPRLAVEGRGAFAAFFAPDFVRFVFCTALTSLPFLAIVGVLALPVLGAGGMSFGMFEGGIIAFPLLGFCLFVAVTVMALVPTAVFAAMEPSEA